VELTRHPDGLAAGLVALTRVGGVIPGTEAVAHELVVGPEVSGHAVASQDFPLAGFQPKLARRIRQLRALGATIDFQEDRRRMSRKAKVLLALVGGALIVVLYAVMLGITVALTGIAFALYMSFLVGPVLLLDSLLRGG
jgi:hypothetical protein